MNNLTTLALRSIKGTGKIQNLNDGSGLYLRVSPTGTATWRLEYAFAGERRSKTLGRFPTVPLAEARRERDRVKSDIAAGVDPDAVAEAEAEAEATPRTFADLAAEHIFRMRKAGLAETTLTRHAWLVNDLAGPLHSMAVTEIKPKHVLDVIRNVAESGRRDGAVRCRAIVRSIFDRAIIEGEIETNPAAPLGKALPPVTVTSRAAVTDEREFGKLLLAIDGLSYAPSRRALQLMALCYARPGETRRAQWAHINWRDRQWVIPAEIMKMGREHIVPLSRQAIELLERQREVSGKGRYIFPNKVRDDIMSPCTLLKILGRIGYGHKRHVPHGFRSSASTILNERGWRYDVIEVSLAHLEANKVRRAYNRALYLPERTEMAQAWADICDELRAKAHRKAEIDGFL